MKNFDDKCGAAGPCNFGKRSIRNAKFGPIHNVKFGRPVVVVSPHGVFVECYEYADYEWAGR